MGLKDKRKEGCNFMQQVAIRVYHCVCEIKEFHIPSEKLSDEDEILCPYCGDIPRNAEDKISEIYTRKEKGTEI